MDIEAIEQQLVSGEELKIKYKFPIESGGTGDMFGVRTDKLYDVSIELRRFYTKFRGDFAIWVSEDEVVEITEDDGQYEDFPSH